MKKKINQQLLALLPQLKAVTENIQSIEDDWPSSFNKNNPEDLYVFDMYYAVKQLLDKSNVLIEVINKPVAFQGKLYKNNGGRYALSENNYFTSGQPIEILIQNDQDTYWYRSRVEHNGDDYYVVGYNGSLDGLMARIK